MGACGEGAGCWPVGAECLRTLATSSQLLQASCAVLCCAGWQGAAAASPSPDLTPGQYSLWHTTRHLPTCTLTPAHISTSCCLITLTPLSHPPHLFFFSFLKLGRFNFIFSITLGAFPHFLHPLSINTSYIFFTTWVLEAQTLE